LVPFFVTSIPISARASIGYPECLDFDWPESGGSTNKNVTTGWEEDRVKAIVDNPSFASTHTGNRIRGKCQLRQIRVRAFAIMA
jgi:hypothetical protein